MKLSSTDFALLRRSVFIMAGLVAMGAATVVAARHFVALEEQANRQALAQRDRLQVQLSGASEEDAAIRAKIIRYRELRQRGFIGPEHRLEWVERIASIKADRQIAAIQYELSPQKPLVPLPGSRTLSDHEFMASTMKLQMQLLHEDDLVRLLRDLADGAAAVLKVQSCSVERIAGNPAEVGGANLRAECTIDWTTLKERT